MARAECLLNRLTGDALNVKLRSIKMAAQEVAGAATLRCARGERKARQAPAVITEIAVLARCRFDLAARLVESGPRHARFFTRSDNPVNGPGTHRRVKVHGSFDVARTGLVFLRAEGAKILRVHGRNAGHRLRSASHLHERRIVGFIARGRAFFAIHPDGDVNFQILTPPVGGEAVGRKSKLGVILILDKDLCVIRPDALQDFPAEGFSFFLAEQHPILPRSSTLRPGVQNMDAAKTRHRAAVADGVGLHGLAFPVVQGAAQSVSRFAAQPVASPPEVRGP